MTKEDAISQVTSIKVNEDEILVIAIKGPDIDQDLIQTMRDQLRKQLGGENRVLLMGMDEDTEVKLATVPKPEDPPAQLNLKVSGKEIYKAVKNYIKSDKDIYSKVKDSVQQLINQGEVAAAITKFVALEWSGEGRRLMRQMMDKAVREVVMEKIDAEIKSEVKNAMKSAVLLVPRD